MDNEAFKYLPDIRKLGITDITEDEFYTLLKLTKQEINQIKHQTTNEDVEVDDDEVDIQSEEPVVNVNTVNEPIVSIKKSTPKKSINLLKTKEKTSSVEVEPVVNPSKTPPKSASPTTKKRTSSPKAPVINTKRKVKGIKGTGGASKKNKTKKHSKVKIPRKTIRRRKY